MELYPNKFELGEVKFYEELHKQIFLICDKEEFP